MIDEIEAAVEKMEAASNGKYPMMLRFLLDRVATLEAALEPFALAMDAVSPYDAITLGDLRRAKETLSRTSGEEV